MSELTWLAEVIANFDLSPKLKKHIIKRMKAVDGSPLVMRSPPTVQRSTNISAQAPSTAALLEKHGLATPDQPIATSPQAVQALTQRQMLIAQAENGKPLPGQTSPIKMRGPLK